MTRRWKGVAGGTILAALAALMATAVPSQAAPAVSMRLGTSVSIVQKAQDWRTCVPQQIDYLTQQLAGGGELSYRIDNSEFAGQTARACIRSDMTEQGANLTVLTNAPYQSGGVVRAPRIMVGQWYNAGGGQSPFPMPARQMQPIALHVVSNCSAPGRWLVDSDSFGYTSDGALFGNPSVELVVANCWQDYTPKGERVRVDGHWWLANHWITGQGSPMGAHPIIVFTLVRQDPKLRERLPRFVTWAGDRNWWPFSIGPVVGNTCLQAETWWGAKGLRLGLDLTDSIPVIRKLGSTS
jgi:hypothetical protein